MPPSIAVTEATSQSEVIQSALPVVVNLWAPWCGPCRPMAPLLGASATRYAGCGKVVKVNVDEGRGRTSAFKVQGSPTLSVLRGQTIIDQQVGRAGRARVERRFERAATALVPS